LDHVLVLENDVDMLSNVRAMQVVVVLDVPLVLVVDLSGELKELVVVNNLEQIVVFQNRCCHKRHLHVPAHCLGELKQVEVKRVDALKVIVMLLDQSVHVFARKVEVDSVLVYLGFHLFLFVFEIHLFLIINYKSN
jgi:hypothetical protein